MAEARIRIPQIQSIETALRIYCEKNMLGNKEIRELFGNICSRSVSALKKIAKNQMLEDDVPEFNAVCVDTKAAYKAWGLDIKDMESRYKKMEKLGIQRR